MSRTRNRINSANPFVFRMLLMASALMIILTPSQSLSAQRDTLEPGIYVTEGGWGDLAVTRSKDGTVSFTIFALGGNAHMCDLGGEIRNGRATLAESGEVESPCVIRFEPVGASIKVSAETYESCRYYCGMRANFEGDYLKPAPACLPKAIRKSRRDFKRLYDRKAYAEAVAVLEPLLKGCSKTMTWVDKGWIRNDLALAYHRMKRDDICLSLLKDFEADAAKTDEQIREEYPPADADTYWPILNAARTNLKLCRDGKP